MPTAIETQYELSQKEYKNFWISNPKRRQVFNMLIAGKSLTDIYTEAHTHIDFVKKTTSHPAFLKRLEAYLLQVFFNYQVNRILALDEVFKYYWDIVMGRKFVDDLNIDQASKHLVKLLEQKEAKPTVINPKQFNIIMNILKASPEKLPDLAREFGFENLKPQDEGPVTNPQLDKGEGNKNQ